MVCERKKERSTILNPVLFPLTEAPEKFINTLTRKFINTITPLCFVSGIFVFQSNLINMFFHVIFGRTRPLFHITSKSNALLKICPHHRTPPALASQPKISFKPSKHISSWLLFFSINFNFTHCSYPCFFSSQNCLLIFHQTSRLAPI